ncbi:putative HTH-type transcriptional regulator YybR [Actinomadura rubteroloni]|uniref:Putative HTH-type transcriptional regulator YybR n=1 Tax=Actinomadura rubteroloni TaxID=1926885 RepID=A0A2P4ULN2_9ACTN|nr:helix-turn-helix domain-containing protein [Actinomadura rubteroloni]POM25909.1 putative HTH-type transcriptional regulator YybR [Actinomadura rubteroloni]
MALPRSYVSQNCSVARSLEVVGDRWTLLVVRAVFEGHRRFDDFQDDLGIARNVLTDRLTRLCDEGLLRRVRYQERPDRFEYRPTRKCVELWPAMMTLMLWGDRYYAPDGPPRVVAHRGCTGTITSALTCSACGAALGPGDVVSLDGPGA